MAAFLHAYMRAKMFSSFRLFTLFGTEVSLNTTLFYMALFHFTTVVSGSGTFETLNHAVPLYIAAFASILVHEFGHVAAAHLRGIGCKKVTLHALGGFALLDRAPEKSLDEFLIAIAGPITSLILGGAIAGALWLPVEMPDFVLNLLFEVAVINVVIAVFNMIPAYPMDGGQVLHAILGGIMPRFWADRICVIVGQLLAVCLMALGAYLMMLTMVLIAAFIFAFAAIGLKYRVFWFLRTKRSSATIKADDGLQS